MMALPWKFILPLILVFCVQLTLVLCMTHNTVRGMKFICGSFAPELVDTTCHLKKINRTLEYWSTNGSYAPGVYSVDPYINVTFYARQTNLEWRPHMVVNYILDYCKYFDGSLTNKLIDILFVDLKRSSNFLQPCPHSGIFIISNMTLSVDRFPPIVPAAEIYIDFQYYMYHKNVLRKTVYFRPYLEFKTKGIIYW